MTKKSDLPLMLSRKKVREVLGISEREFYSLISAGKFHPIQTHGKQYRVPLAEVLALKAELSHKTLALPCEKFIQASAFFYQNPIDVNNKLVELGYPKIPEEYIIRHHRYANIGEGPDIIKGGSFTEFIKKMGAAKDILYRRNIRLLVECLSMIGRGEKDIAEIVKAKYSRTYKPEDIEYYIDYFYNWAVMDPDSADFYFKFLQGREKMLKECAAQRSDYFIYYAFGIDFGGEVSELLERSCLGLLYKMNYLIDGHVYGDIPVSTRELQNMAHIINTMLGAAKQSREGHMFGMPKNNNKGVPENIGQPVQIKRDSFFKLEKGIEFGSTNN